MPRYFFDIRDGEADIDDEGTELADLTEARTEAIRFAGDYLSNNPSLVKDTGTMLVELLDEHRTPFLRVTVSLQPLRMEPSARS